MARTASSRLLYSDSASSFSVSFCNCSDDNDWRDNKGDGVCDADKLLLSFMLWAASTHSVAFYDHDDDCEDIKDEDEECGDYWMAFFTVK